MGPVTLRCDAYAPPRNSAPCEDTALLLEHAIDLTGLRCGAAYELSVRGRPALRAASGFAHATGLADFFGYPSLLGQALARADGRIARLRGSAPYDGAARSVLARAGVSLLLLVPGEDDTMLVLGAPRISVRWRLGGPTHTQRVSRYCRLLARLSGLPERYAELVAQAGALHDVGKLSVPGAILEKPGALTAAERRRVEHHAHDGRLMLSGPEHPLADLAAQVAWTHHEHWDGSGYPRGLRGEQIPLEGRITAIADVFDALTSDRSYRPALELEDALARLRAGAGSHFDPVLAELFADALPRLYQLQQRILQQRAPAQQPYPALALALV